jgi:hypothetical protein
MPELLPRPIVQTGDVAVEGHRHVQPDRIDHADLHFSSMTPEPALPDSRRASISQRRLQVTGKLIGLPHRPFVADYEIDAA